MLGSKHYSYILQFLKYLAAVIVGVIIGGYIFSDTQPRSVTNIPHCENTCYTPKDLVGLLTSTGISKGKEFIPNVVFETDKSIVIKHPFPEARIHYVIFPKKDIKNIGEITKEDMPYIEDSLMLMSTIIKKEKLTDYRIITNGPGFQHTTYLHFHLRAN